MRLESLINEANDFYYASNIALINKISTPLKIKKVKDNNVYSQLYKKSTVDYCGIYKGKFICFEAKSCESKTSFPLSNIKEHQIEYMKKIDSFGGVSFVILEMNYYSEYYIISIKHIVDILKIKNSINYEQIKMLGRKIKLRLNPILEYICYLDNL